MSERTAGIGNDGFSFGPFRLYPARKLLVEEDRPVRLGSRALDLLIALVEMRGELVAKDELIKRIWPTTFVEEGNLRVHIAALRRALGDGRAGSRYIVNVPGRGYRFVAEVTAARESVRAAETISGPGADDNLPARLVRMIGRDQVVETVARQLPERRFISIVGTGGIGKTTVALSVADRVRATYRDGVRFVDLAPLGDPLLVPNALATALGVSLHSADVSSGVVAFLRDRHMLLVLDNCEHVIESSALLAEQILKGASQVHILATSREPLRAVGEHVRRLAPLDIPTSTEGLTATNALAFSAVQLFVERAAARVDGFELADIDAPIVAEICRRLDGIALAIELAAGRVDAFGIGRLSALLEDRFRLLVGGRRTALPRHQTLVATLDWSYEALAAAEREVLCRLAIFAGGFDLESANAVAEHGSITAGDVVHNIANLVAKSLVAADVTGDVVRYRLLDTTRAYALRKLADRGEFDEAARRHADYYLDLFERAEAEWKMRPADEWLAAYAWQIDNLRAALDWAFSPSGDSAAGVDLTVAVVPLWMHLSLVDECRRRVEQALAFLGTEAAERGRSGLRLYAALGMALMITRGTVPETRAALTKALEIAEGLDDTECRLRALWGLWAGSLNNGVFAKALTLAKEFRGLAAASEDPADMLIGDRLIGTSLHFLGDQAAAQQHIERMLAAYVPPAMGSHATRFQFDQRVIAHVMLARTLWLRGFADQAMRSVESSVDRATSIGHTLSLGNALAQGACPVSLLAGDLAAAERFTGMLLRLTALHALDIWNTHAKACRGALLIRRGDLDAGLPLLRAAIADLREAQFVQYQTAFLAVLAEGLESAGLVAEGIDAIDEALSRTDRTGERWCVADLLRIKGKLSLAQKKTNETAAEALFLRALDVAGQQEALSWQLRAATCLARLWRDQGRSVEGHDLLTKVYGGFSEGFGTADLKEASSLLDGLSSERRSAGQPDQIERG